jgi:hypothetical protein
MQLHLFSTPGENDIRYIVEASRPYLEDRDDPIVAYMPLASLYAERWMEFHEILDSYRPGCGWLTSTNLS